MKTMRILLLGAATVALSGCSFLGLGGHKDNSSYNANNGYYGHTAQAAPKACHSDKCLARWNIEGGIGPSFAVGGNAVTGSKTHQIAGKNVKDLSWNDMYDMGYRAELGGSYAVNPNRKVTATAFLEKADSSGVQDWGNIAAGQNLRGSLSDYESYGGEVGLRQYFKIRNAPIVKSLRPYVEGRLGATFIDDISVENATVNGVAAPTLNTQFYDSGWVGSAAGLVGVETPLTRYSTIGLETGVRYTQALDSSAAVAGSSPIAGANNSRGRTTIPVMLRGRYRF
jgi:hypothetical protein